MTLQGNRAAFNQFVVDSTCKLYSSLPETRQHFLEECAVFKESRQEYIQKLTDSGILSFSAKEEREKEKQMQFEREKLEKQREMEEREKEKHREMLKEIELEKERMHYDIKMKELELSSKSMPPVSFDPSKVFDVTKHIRLVPPFQEKEVDKYFLHFEKVAENLKWPKEHWTLLLQSVVIGKAREIYTQLPLDQKKVQVGKDQEKAQSEKDSHSKNRGGKKPN